MRKLKHGEIDTMNKPVLVILFAIVAIIFGIGMIIGETQTDTACIQPVPVAVDYTDLYLDPADGLYAKWYSGDPVLMQEAEAIQDDLLRRRVPAGYGAYITDHHWMIVYRTFGKIKGKHQSYFVVFVGNDFTVGSDGLWHKPCGIYGTLNFKWHEWTPHPPHTPRLTTN